MKTLVTLPTPRTRQRLESIFMSSPMPLNLDTLLVVLAVVEDEQLPDIGVSNPDAEFSAHVTEYGVRTDPYRSNAELVAVLESASMRKRSLELGMPEDFQIKLVVVPYSPSQSISVRNFNVSIADTLVLHEKEPFTFYGEVVL